MQITLLKTKQCTKCKVEKSIESFKLRKDGYRNSWCQGCKKENSRQNGMMWYEKYTNKIPSGVYMITCNKNGKRYIGSSNQPNRRKKEHWCLSNDPIRYSNVEMRNDMLEYGREYFTFNILEHCSVDMLIQRERYYQKLYNPEYNSQGQCK